MNTLMFRYLVIHLAKVIAAVTLVFLSLFFVLSLLENLGDDLGGLVGSLRDAALKLPEVTHLILPATCAIGTAIGLAMLDNQGEMALLRIMGVSVKRLLRWIAALAVAWIIVHASIGEFLLAKSALIARNIENQKNNSFITGGEKIWLKTPAGFARIGLVTPDARNIHDLWLFDITAGTNLHRVIRARQASHDGNHWLLENTQIATLADDHWSFADQATMDWTDGPSPQLLNSLSIDPQHLPVMRLVELSRTLGELGQNTLAYDLVIWSRVVDTLAIAVLMLAGLLAVNNRTDTTHFSTTRAVGVVALVVMVLYYYASLIIRQATVTGGWPVALGAGLPLLLLALVLGGWAHWKHGAGYRPSRTHAPTG